MSITRDKRSISCEVTKLLGVSLQQCSQFSCNELGLRQRFCFKVILSTRSERVALRQDSFALQTAVDPLGRSSRQERVRV